MNGIWMGNRSGAPSAAGIGLYLGTGERLEDNYMSGSRYLDVVYWSDFVLVAQFVESNHWALQGH